MLTAFGLTEALLRQRLAGAGIAAETLRRLLRRVELIACHGMCCHDGVYLEEEEAVVLADLAEREAKFFRALGLDLPSPVVVEGDFQGLMAGPKTATVPRAWVPRVEAYPAHFPDTACCFLLEDGRCGLQLLSEARGRHRWYFKPTGCWLHPLTLDYDSAAPLGLHDSGTDPFRLLGYGGYVSRTFCGRETTDGPPAHETLQEELAFLGAIVGRDLAAEANPAGRIPLDVLPGPGEISA